MCDLPENARSSSPDQWQGSDSGPLDCELEKNIFCHKKRDGGRWNMGWLAAAGRPLPPELPELPEPKFKAANGCCRSCRTRLKIETFLF
jgi:hypothetical protein